MDGGKSSVQRWQDIYDGVPAQAVYIQSLENVEDNGYLWIRGDIRDAGPGITLKEWVGADKRFALGYERNAKFGIFIDSVAQFNLVVASPGQMKTLVAYILDKTVDWNNAKITKLCLHDIRDLSYESLCILFYLKSQRPNLEIGVVGGRAEALRDSGVRMWEIFATFNRAVDFDNMQLPTEAEYNTQVADYQAHTINTGDGIGSGAGNNNNNNNVNNNRGSAGGPVDSTPMHPLMITGIVLTAVGTATAFTALGSALGGAEFALSAIPGGEVMVYQAMMLGGSILTLLGMSMILFEGRHENKPKIIRQYGGDSDSMLAMIGQNIMVYAPAMVLAVEGGIGLLAAYTMIMYGGVGANEMMAILGGGLGFLTLAAAGAVIVIDKVNDQPIDWPFVSQIVVGGLATTAIAAILPWVMVNTAMFTDPMMASVSVFSAMAVVPLLGLMAKGITMGIQQLAADAPDRA